MLIFVSFIRVVLIESTLTYFCFTLNSYLVCCYASSRDCIYLFTFNSDILPFECKILIKIPDSVLDSALALRGKEGDIAREKL